MWSWDLRSTQDLTVYRSFLREAVTATPVPADVTADGVEALLLAFEELASNGLRHGEGPVRVSVSATADGWLVDVTDAAPGRPPVPALDRDPALGGLGLYLVARLCSSYGWWVESSRKHVWGCLSGLPA